MIPSSFFVVADVMTTNFLGTPTQNSQSKKSSYLPLLSSASKTTTSQQTQQTEQRDGPKSWFISLSETQEDKVPKHSNEFKSETSTKILSDAWFQEFNQQLQNFTPCKQRQSSQDPSA